MRRFFEGGRPLSRPPGAEAMTESFPHTSLLTAFLAGLLSFASPCVLPLVPSYLMYITGLSLEQLSDSTERQRRSQAIVANSCLFIAGFSIVFIRSEERRVGKEC